MTDTSPLDLNTIQALGFELIHGLERPSVLGQLLISAIAIASAILVNQKLKPWLRKYDHWLAPLIPITISILLLVIAGFFYRALGTKFGLINKAAELAALLWMINYSMILIKHFTQSNRVNFYKRRLVLPVFIAFSAFSLTDLISDRTQVFNADLFRLFGTNITIGDLILITFGLYWWIILSSLLTEFLQWSFGLGSTGNPQSNKGFYILIRYALIGLGSFVIIGYVGINPTVFGLITGGLSVGLGLGLKEVVSNFASGIWLLIEGALKPGDIINLSSIDQSKDPYEIGFISHLGLRAATIVSYSDNSERIVPNQTFFTNQIQTYTRSQNIIARKVWIGVSYGSNPIQVIELLEQLGSDHPRILNTPRPKAYFTTYGESSLNFCLKFWIKEISDGLTVSSEINCQIWELFQDKGIEIPFPQAVVHMVTPDQDPGI
ncbi:MAG: mechanosensitive ion channel [Synechococcus sp. ChBW.bin.23]